MRNDDDLIDVSSALKCRRVGPLHGRLFLYMGLKQARVVERRDHDIAMRRLAGLGEQACQAVTTYGVAVQQHRRRS